MVVRGETRPPLRLSLFTEMQMEQTDGEKVLTGRVIDQAQLHGFIERLEELGLELFSFEQTSRALTGLSP